ncbi:MAG: hypothetical protein R3A52_07795 [Polyangiales bacterium]
MRWPPMNFGAVHRSLLRASFRDLCATREWKLFALAVEDDHVHVLLAASEAPVEIRCALKCRATTDLKRADLVPRDRPVWADYGNIWRIQNEAHFIAAYDYVLRHRE